MCLVARTEVFSGESANLPGRTKIDLFQQLIDLISALETCFEAKRAPTLQVPAPDTWDIGLIWQAPVVSILVGFVQCEHS